MILDIVQAGDPVLRQRAEPLDVSHIGTPELDELITNMVETMHAAPGVGLAAPQIGLGIRLVVIEDRVENIESLDETERAERLREAVPLTVLINPEIELVGDETVSFFEGCLSVEGWAAETPRHERARVSALNEKGEHIVLEWEGWPARILQHELDHLAGVLYVDRMDTKTFASTKVLMAADED